MATLSLHEIHFPSHGYGEDMFAPIVSSHPRPDWQSCPNTARDFDEWLQETFGDEEKEQEFVNSLSAAPQSALPFYENGSSNGAEYVAKIVDKLDIDIGKLRMMKRTILSSSSSNGKNNAKTSTPKQSMNKQKKFSVPSVVPVSPISSKKRKRASMDDSSSGSESDESSTTGVNREAQKINRREQNRVSAKKCRLKKKQAQDQMKESLEFLKEENKKLRDFVNIKLGSEKAKSLVQQQLSVNAIEDERKQAAKNKSVLLSALQNPTSRSMNNNTLAFLRTLSDQVATM